MRCVDNEAYRSIFETYPLKSFRAFTPLPYLTTSEPGA